MKHFVLTMIPVLNILGVMDEPDFELLVQNVVRDFEQERRVRVTEGAVDALIKPALPHLSDVSEALNNRRFGPEFLRSCLRVVLENAIVLTLETRAVPAFAYAGEEDDAPPAASEIDEESIRKSMSRYCPYLFWC